MTPEMANLHDDTKPNGQDHSEPLTFPGKLAAAEAENRHEVATAARGEDLLMGPFDAQVAFDAIVAAKADVDDAQKDVERTKDMAKRARDRYDEAVTALSDKIAELRRWETGEDEMQPRLRTVNDVPADENVHERRQRLAEQLTRKNLYISADELTPLERGDLDTLDQWLLMPDGVVPPELLMKAHVAGEIHEDDENGDQACTRCGLVFSHPVPVGAFVGLECVGEDPLVRTTPRRGRKRPRTPEAEHAAQTAEAQQKSE